MMELKHVGHDTYVVISVVSMSLSSKMGSRRAARDFVVFERKRPDLRELLERRAKHVGAVRVNVAKRNDALNRGSAEGGIATRGLGCFFSCNLKFAGASTGVPISSFSGSYRTSRLNFLNKILYLQSLENLVRILQ